jgi:hypothetical protein
MNLMLNMKDINKILAKTHIKCKKKKRKSEKTHIFAKTCLFWKSPCHAFTSPSCSLREKSSPYFLQVWWVLAVSFEWNWKIVIYRKNNLSATWKFVTDRKMICQLCCWYEHWNIIKISNIKKSVSKFMI